MQEKQITSEFIDIKTMDIRQEREVFAAIRSGDKTVKQRLIDSCMVIVSEMADKCSSSAVSFEEVFSEAYAVVLEAIRRYDCDTQERFNEYLVRLIEECVQYLYNNLTWFLPIDYRVMGLHDRYIKALEEIYKDYERIPDEETQDEEYIAYYLGVSRDELRAMKNEYYMCSIESLDTPVEQDDLVSDDVDGAVPFIETIPDPKTVDNAAVKRLDELLDCLSDDERYVVCARNGVISVMEAPDEQIAVKLGIQNKEVEVIYRNAIEKMRKSDPNTE